MEALASKAAKYMVATTASQLSCVFKHGSKCENLWGKVEELKCARQREDEKKAMENYFAGFLLDTKNSYQLGKKADEEAEAITQLLNEKDRFDRVSYRPALEGISIRPVKEYEAFGSRSDAFNGAMAALEDDNVNVIGVYGMGGVGKTTLVSEAARHVKEKKLFDEVVFVAVKQTPNMVTFKTRLLRS
ncbi:hypothetical protein GOBAR_AA15066 [Gossypium barbadense]|uniref:NB-ARC domain-containing protein n=1 Tax=Gossypium barbadense TaxID=3634 RepID=A0A2P5XQF2_GOSBA|nr:hypothetical protein GOBAR_AA15066 [Gossypium barbadense]